MKRLLPRKRQSARNLNAITESDVIANIDIIVNQIATKTATEVATGTDTEKRMAIDIAAIATMTKTNTDANVLAIRATMTDIATSTASPSIKKKTYPCLTKKRPRTKTQWKGQNLSPEIHG